MVIVQNGVEATKTASHVKGQYSISLPLVDLAKACHLRLDDVVSTLIELGFLRHRRRTHSTLSITRNHHHHSTHTVRSAQHEEGQPGEDGLGKVSTSTSTSGSASGLDDDEWKDVEVIISRDAVNREWGKWKVRPKGVLDESCVLL